jgi:Rrf2 family protein
MNRIHRKVEYALIALKHMRAKAQGDRTTAKEIAALYGCPPDVLARVLQTLANRSILISEQGVRGGYVIAKDLSRVSFYDLLEMILGPMEVARCLHEAPAKSATNVGLPAEGTCEMRGTCNIVSPIQLLNRKMTEFYRSLTVLELIEAGRAGKSRAAGSVAVAPLSTSLDNFVSQVGGDL